MTYQQNPLVDEYITHFDPEIKERLTRLRSAIQAAFPHTIEDISYGMPTYRPAPGKRGLVYFAGAKGHIGLYAIFDPESSAPLHKKMQPYRTGKGTLQFSNEKPFPMDTIRQVLAYHAGKIGS